MLVRGKPQWEGILLSQYVMLREPPKHVWDERPSEWLTSRGATVTTSIFAMCCQDSERGILRCWHQGQLRPQWHESNYNSGYSSRKISTQSGTDHDDFLSGEVKTFHIRLAWETPQRS